MKSSNVELVDYKVSDQSGMDQQEQNPQEVVQDIIELSQQISKKKDKKEKKRRKKREMVGTVAEYLDDEK